MSGLMEQIEKAAPQSVTVDITPESVKQLLISFAMLNAHQNRDFVMMTGRGGAELLNDSIEREAYRTILDDDKDKYSEEEYTRLSDMISSTDRENLQLAKIIIRQTIS